MCTAQERFMPYVPRGLVIILLDAQATVDGTLKTGRRERYADATRQIVDDLGIDLEVVISPDAEDFTDVLVEDVDEVVGNFFRRWLEVLSTMSLLAPVSLDGTLLPRMEGRDEGLRQTLNNSVGMLCGVSLPAESAMYVLAVFAANVRQGMANVTERIPLNDRVVLVVDNGAFALEHNQSA
jgi:hypothetical protein